MGSVAERDARLQASVYRVHGEPATWRAVGGADPLTVRVIRATDSEIREFGEGRLIVGTGLFRVRPSEVAAPSENDELDIPDRGETWRVIGEPMRTRFGLDWLFQVMPVA